MINLTPINKKIQKRLFEKMDILGRKTSTNTNQPAKGGGDLTHAKMATRSTFLRMTSGQLNPVILMGGKLKDDGSMYGGYDDIYGSRSYKTDGTQHTLKLEKQFIGPTGKFQDVMKGTQGVASTTNTLENKLKRPMPGVKGVDVTFKGGVRALREATITWTCWDFEELDFLMPHFLAHGKTVMVEWGWVYDKDTLKKLPDFVKTDEVGNKYLSANIYNNYRKDIFDANGDFDMMVGIIKNFEFTTREDGAFDCTTILTSVGASIMENPQANEVALDPNITYNLTVNEDSKQTAARIKKAVGEEGTESDERGNRNSLINLNTTVSLKLFIKEIDRYVFESTTGLGKQMRAYDETGTSIQQSAIEKGFFNDKLKKDENLFGMTYKDKSNANDVTTSYMIGSSNKYIQSLRFDSGNGVQSLSKTWVRWGWFEDNVLSKFLSVTSKPNAKPGELNYSPVITEFRSIERLLDKDSNDSNEYESVRIKNSNQLQTTNINHYILPGQLYPQTPKTFEIEDETIELPGDTDFLQKLKTLTVDNFSQFTTSTETIPRAETVYEDVDIMKDVFGDFTPKKKKVGTKKQVVKNLDGTDKTTIVDQIVPGKHGYLRNMLINTDLIKQAFGVSEEFTVESINVIESIESLFSLLNQELNFWNYKITTDEVETNRAKIIDDQVTNFDFSTNTLDQQSFMLNDEDVITNSTWEEGVFFFPVWRSDTIVKRQSITAKIPDEMQLSIMYGSNMDQLKDFANPGSQFSEKEGVLAGGLFNKNQDAHKGGLDIAYRNTNTEKLGVVHGKGINDASTPLRATEGDDIKQFLIDNSSTIEEKFEERLKNINDKLKISAEAQAAFTSSFDSTVPPPFASRLTDTEIKKLLKFEKSREFFGLNKGELTELFGTVFHKTGEMKAQFKSSVSYLTTQHGKYKQSSTPLLIPLEIELDIDGIGGIYPGNSYHSTYVPSRYQANTVFQCFDVNHRLDSSGWTVTLSGKMRATMDNIFDGFKTLEELEDASLENYQNKANFKEEEARRKAAEAQKFTKTRQAADDISSGAKR